MNGRIIYSDEWPNFNNKYGSFLYLIILGSDIVATEKSDRTEAPSTKKNPMVPEVGIPTDLNRAPHDACLLS